MSQILLVPPPFTQLNTPYPATPYLKGFLNTKNISSYQIDLGIEVILQLFKKQTIGDIFSIAQHEFDNFSENALRIFMLKESYINTIEEVIHFIQGKNPSLARKICGGEYLPQASRFQQTEEMEWAFGTMGYTDQAKHMCTLYLEDLSDFIIEQLDPHFGFSRYAEQLGRSAYSFDNLSDQLNESPGFIEKIALEILEKTISKHQPELIGFSVPFPGNLFSAFRCAQMIKLKHPHITTVMGGGFPNTELREVKDPRVFQYFDFISLDDGERPLELIIQNHLLKEVDVPHLKRTFQLKNNQVFYNDLSELPDYPQKDSGTPDYSDLPLEQYLSVIEIANPMHSLWSDGRWNKLTLAHGCYWAKCTFCDISLDYIHKYEPLTAKLIVDRIEIILQQTGETGFHFVDEAAPPALMKELALELLKRKLSISWWTNIRFEKSFTSDLCRLLKSSGCIAVSGGLEVASDRLLGLINKGVSVQQVAKVMRNFTDAGLMVHAYLMYGYPTQSEQETIDSLEMVRQMFEEGILQSGFWHRFALTAHSPIGMQPDKFNISPEMPAVSFALNDLQFTDHSGVQHEKFSFGLKKSLYNFMNGVGLDFELKDWFDFRIPSTTIPHNYIDNTLEENHAPSLNWNSRIIWLGNPPLIQTGKKKKLNLIFQNNTEISQISMNEDIANWLFDILPRTKVDQSKMTLEMLRDSYEKIFADFEIFWLSKPMQRLRKAGLLIL